jgi:Recombination endonuclease VII
MVYLDPRNGDSRRRLDGLMSTAEYSRKWRAANPDREAAHRQKRRDSEYDKTRWAMMTEKGREANRIAVRLYSAKNRAKLREQQRRRQRSRLPSPTRSEPLLCECCGSPPSGRGALHLDHDHLTNRFRGWLCQRCNMGIGQLGDDLRGIQRAAAYLQRGES